MQTISTYADPSASYTVHHISIKEVEQHCNRYMDSITGLVFHGSEISHKLELMQEAIGDGKAIKVLRNGIECGFMYLIPVRYTRANLIAVQADDAAIEAILIHEMYSTGRILRYTPRDPSYSLYNTIVQPVSMRMYTEDRVEYVKLIPNLDTVQLLDKFKLIKVVTE